MGLIATLLSFVRVDRNGAKTNDVTFDVNGGVNHTADHFATPGNDSYPVVNIDYCIAVETPQSGSKAVVGYLDPVNEGKAVEGETRSYARNPSNGAPVNEVWLKNDGSVLIANDNGSLLLRPDGSMIGSNGAGSFELNSSGNLVLSGSLIAPSAIINGVEHATHTHAQPNDSNGDTEANTTGPI